ncbi:nucleoside 2-deoxyribosyltransferase [Roseomonas elaeocarpi]|uniref:Nucleoside 2-deoxyribosyltransferase n=1 Tax=Roseomonas elaeocarpi TaxID=907779 RepID=A0ABV6JRQ4_9PROT
MKAYLAGPDVFLPEARAQARRKVEICARYGITGRPPLNEDAEGLAAIQADEPWLAIYRKDVAMMEECDIVIANLTPFRGPSADAGTLVEIGWFVGRGRPVFGYSNDGRGFGERSRDHLLCAADPIPGITVEDFGVPDNLMVPGAVLDGGGLPLLVPEGGAVLPFDALEVFERCVAAASRKLGLRGG